MPALHGGCTTYAAPTCSIAQQGQGHGQSQGHGHGQSPGQRQRPWLPSPALNQKGLQQQHSVARAMKQPGRMITLLGTDAWARTLLFVTFRRLAGKFLRAWTVRVLRTPKFIVSWSSLQDAEADIDTRTRTPDTHTRHDAHTHTHTHGHTDTCRMCMKATASNIRVTSLRSLCMSMTGNEITVASMRCVCLLAARFQATAQVICN